MMMPAPAAPSVRAVDAHPNMDRLKSSSSRIGPKKNPKLATPIDSVQPPMTAMTATMTQP